MLFSYIVFFIPFFFFDQRASDGFSEQSIPALPDWFLLDIMGYIGLDKVEVIPLPSIGIIVQLRALITWIMSQLVQIFVSLYLIAYGTSLL